MVRRPFVLILIALCLFLFSLLLSWSRASEAYPALKNSVAPTVTVTVTVASGDEPTKTTSSSIRIKTDFSQYDAPEENYKGKGLLGEDDLKILSTLNTKSSREERLKKLYN